MKIYTRTGDDGTTGLPGGQRIRKSDPRIECTGTIDELSAAVGLAAASADPLMAADLRRVQDHLFVIGSHLAVPPDHPSPVPLPALDEKLVSQLESKMDAADEQLAPLQQFILPGGSEPACRLHLARTICRRAERLIVAMAMTRPLPPAILAYLNRLSDWLFVMARLANKQAGMSDIIWEKEPPAEA